MGKRPDQPLNSQNSLLIPCLFMVSSGDRIAPACTIRHPVCLIVALQRRVGFSAWLALGFAEIGVTRDALEGAELASSSVFVSDRDFRVPRLRQIGERALTGAVRPDEKRPPAKPRIEVPGLPRYSWPSKFWSCCGPGLLYVHLFQGRGSRSSPRERGIRFLDGVSLPVRGTRIASRTSPS